MEIQVGKYDIRQICICCQSASYFFYDTTTFFLIVGSALFLAILSYEIALFFSLHFVIASSQICYILIFLTLSSIQYVQKDVLDTTKLLTVFIFRLYYNKYILTL